MDDDTFVEKHIASIGESVGKINLITVAWHHISYIPFFSLAVQRITMPKIPIS